MSDDNMKQQKKTTPTPPTFAETVIDLDVAFLATQAQVKATTVVGFCQSDGSYIAASPIASQIGCGDSPEEARNLLWAHHRDMQAAYVEGRTKFNKHNQTAGRPRKSQENLVHLHTLIRQYAKDGLQRLANEKNISMAEAIEYLYLNWLAQQSRHNDSF